MNDLSTEFQQRISNAVEQQQTLNLIGGGSKSFYGRSLQGDDFELAGHQGIIDYEPSELVVTVRSGTPLVQLEASLAEQGQMLGFEPPYFSQKATIGGAISSGLSGPRRPFSGAVRDFVLGCRIINGHAEVLSFGGTVMKNVAGYDLSRLLAGSMGTLAVLLDISLKVVPKPEAELSFWQDCHPDAVLETMGLWMQQSLPFSAMHYDGKRVFYRLAGSRQAIIDANKTLGGGDELLDDHALWTGLREQSSAFFQDNTPLWRISVAPQTPMLELDGCYLLDWGGALRWYKTDVPAEQVFQKVEALGGHAALFRGGNRDATIFQPLPDQLLEIQQRLKLAFDPQGIFNPGRMYPEF